MASGKIRETEFELTPGSWLQNARFEEMSDKDLEVYDDNAKILKRVKSKELTGKLLPRKSDVIKDIFKSLFVAAKRR